MFETRKLHQQYDCEGKLRAVALLAQYNNLNIDKSMFRHHSHFEINQPFRERSVLLRLLQPIRLQRRRRRRRRHLRGHLKKERKFVDTFITKLIIWVFLTPFHPFPSHSTDSSLPHWRHHCWRSCNQVGSTTLAYPTHQGTRHNDGLS